MGWLVAEYEIALGKFGHDTTHTHRSMLPRVSRAAQYCLAAQTLRQMRIIQHLGYASSEEIHIAIRHQEAVDAIFDKRQ
jgi:hypothetical protein